MGERPTVAGPCPACGHVGLAVFHSERDVPANSCLLLESKEEAERFPTGDIELGFCDRCGFISNVRFDQALAEYSPRYEETQAFSPRFVDFARSLAKDWVERYDLAGEHVVEIGCGKGEFLVMMAEAGIGSGLGIDPGVDTSRIDSAAAERLSWLADFFDEDYGPLEAAAVVCRHTLEHISAVGDFVGLIRRAIGDRTDTAVLFELPDTQRVLDEVAFWDVYYEHCSYFSAGSLARLFERAGFEVLRLWRAYDDQYLLLEARPVPETVEQSGAGDDLDALRRGIDHFEAGYATTIDHWRQRIAGVAEVGGTTVIWGAGSKGVAFLSVAGEHVAAAVDINPNKHDMYMAGTGHRIIAPADLIDLDPDLVIVMNPIYLDEIGRSLAELGVTTELAAV